MEVKDLSEIASLSTGEYSACIKLFDKADKAIKKAAIYKKTNSKINFFLAREQVLFSWYHFIRAVYFHNEKNDKVEQKRQLGKSEKHLKKAIVSAFEAPLKEMIDIFDYIEDSYTITIQDTVPKFLEFRNSRLQAEALLDKYASGNTNASYHEHELYEQLFDSLDKGILSLKSASRDLQIRAKQERMAEYVKIAIILGVFVAFMTFLFKFLVAIPAN